MFVVGDGRLTIVRIIFGFVLSKIIFVVLVSLLPEYFLYKFSLSRIVEFAALFGWFHICLYPNSNWLKNIANNKNHFELVSLIYIVGFSALFRIGYEAIIYVYAENFEKNLISDYLNSVQSYSVDSLLSSVIVGPVSEEFFYRGILFLYLCSKLSVRYSLVISAAVFSMIHLNPFVFLSGVVLGSIYLRFGLIVSILVHAFSNLFLMYINTSAYKYLIGSGVSRLLGFSLLFLFLYIIFFKNMKISRRWGI